MTNEDLINALSIHLDKSLNCDNCPFKDDELCFENLIKEIIYRLQHQRS